MSSSDYLIPPESGWFLRSLGLQQALLPQSALSTPYEVLDYSSTLILRDPKGSHATFKRRQRVRFLQHGVSALLERFWGEGIVLTDYQHNAGQLEDSFKRDGVRHLVIGLNRPMGKGEMLEFEVERQAMESFIGTDGLLELTVAHPVRRLVRTIVFPRERPVDKAILDDGDANLDVPIIRLADGRTAVQFRLVEPKIGTRLRLRWRW